MGPLADVGNRRLRLAWPCAVMVLVAALAPSALGAPAPRGSAPRPAVGPVDHVPGEVIVRFKEGVRQAERIDALNARGARFKRALPVRGMQLVRAGAGQTVESAVAAFERDPRVAWAEPNYLRRPALALNDPRLPELWGLENTGQAVNGATGAADADIDATAAWDMTTGDPSVVVAVVDTGVILAHPDIAPNLWTNPGETENGLDDDGNGIVDDLHGADFTGSTPDGDPSDTSAGAMSSHGTHVTSTLAARGGNALGIAGVAPNVRIMPVRALAPNAGSVAGEVSAFQYARAKGARIVNGSFGARGPSNAERNAIAAASDVLFVFAAGNDGLDNDVSPSAFYPCSYDLPNIVCVAATDQNDARAPFSNFGATTVDLAAPGDNVLAAQARFTTVFSDSMDTPDINWTFTGGWAKTTLHAASAPSSLTDSPSGNYSDNSTTANNSARLSSPVDLTGRSGCHLAYDTRFALASNDFLDAESSVDGTKWDLEFYDGGTSNGQFLPTIVDLTHHDGAPAVHVRFGITSLGTGVADGGYVDNVAIRCLFTGEYTGATEEFAFLSGTSMAAPHVSGVAALIRSLDPDLTPAEVKAQILGTVDPVANVPTVTGGRLNAGAAVRMAPRAETRLATGVSFNGATLNGAVNPRLQAATVHFEYGTSTGYELGQTPAQAVPPAGTPQAVSATITGLEPLTVYHFRVVAQNATGSTAGADQTLPTPSAPPPAPLPPQSPPQPQPEPQPQPQPQPQPEPQPQPQPQPQPEAQAQMQPPPPLVPLQTHSTPRRTIPKPGPCARLRGARKSVCLRRQAALRRCARMKPGRAKTRCILRARRIR